MKAAGSFQPASDSLIQYIKALILNGKYKFLVLVYLTVLWNQESIGEKTKSINQTHNNSANALQDLEF